MEQPFALPRQEQLWLELEAQPLLLWEPLSLEPWDPHLQLPSQRLDPPFEEWLEKLLAELRLQEQHEWHQPEAPAPLLPKALCAAEEVRQPFELGCLAWEKDYELVTARALHWCPLRELAVVQVEHRVVARRLLEEPLGDQ